MALNPYLQLPERQYVGARYVPKLAEPFNWNETAVYEPLTIVGYMGSSYTSRKLVPAGTTPVEGEYWALTGNLNGSIQQLQTQINTLDTNLDKLATEHSADITRLETDISENATSITTLSTQVTTNKNDIATIMQDLEDINDLIKKEILIVTDSYGNYPTVQESFSTLVRNRLQNKGSFGPIHILALSGLGFTTSGASFLTGFTNWVNNNTAVAAKLTDIYVLGGANDCITTSVDKNKIVTEISKFATYARANCPNATLHLAAATKKYSTPYEINNFQVYNAYLAGGSENGYDFNADVSQVMCWTPYLNPTDRCHPTQIGANVLANAVVAWLHGEGYEDQITDQKTIPTNVDGISVIIQCRKIGNVKFTGCNLVATKQVSLPVELQFDGSNTAFNPRAGVGVQGSAIIWNGTEFVPCVTTWAAGTEYNVNIIVTGGPDTIAPYRHTRYGYNFQPLQAFAS